MKNQTRLQELLTKEKEYRITPYEVLDVSNIEEARTEFLNNPNIRRPEFKYEGAKNLSFSKLSQNARNLMRMAGEVKTSIVLTKNEKQLANQIIRYDMMNNIMVMDAIGYRTEPNTEINKLAYEINWSLLNSELYAVPDYDMCLAFVAELFSAIDPQSFDRPEQGIYYDGLQKNLSTLFPNNEIPYQTHDGYFMRPEILQKFGEMIETEFASIFAQIPKQEKYTPEEVCDILNNLIETEFGSKTKFRAVIKEDIDNLQVSQTNREIWIPRHRTAGDYDYNTLCRVVIRHEFCTHVYRGAFLEDLGIAPLYQGLTNYEEFEEGLAKIMEATFSKKVDLHNSILYYIGISLAAGFNKDFRQVYDILFQLEYLRTDLSKENAIYKLQKITFNKTRRIFRGTGVLPYYKDLCYFNGFWKAYRYIEENIDNPELFNNLFRLGKIDSSDEKQRKISRVLQQNCTT